MKRLLVDVNVVLDVLLERQPHYAAARALWIAIERRQAAGLVAARAVTTIHYLLQHHHDRRQADRALARPSVPMIVRHGPPQITVEGGHRGLRAEDVFNDRRPRLKHRYWIAPRPLTKG